MIQKLTLCVLAVSTGAFVFAPCVMAQSGGFTDVDVNRDPADPNFLTLALSNQAQADRVYDEISGRILDRFVRGEVGDLFTPIASGQARNREQDRQLRSDRVLSGFVSQTYDNFDFAVAGRDMSADFNNLWIGADALLNERYLVGFSLAHQSFEADGGYEDRVTSRLEDVVFIESVNINGLPQNRSTANTLNYSADYNIGAAKEHIEGWLAVAYAAMEVVPNRLLVSGFISYADNERKASLSGAVVETLDKEILPEFLPQLQSGEITTDFRSNRFEFRRSERNDQTAWNASLSATYFTDLSENLNGAMTFGAQYVAIDVGDAQVDDRFDGLFDVIGGLGAGFTEAETFSRNANLSSDLEEDFAILRAEAMLSYRQEQSIFVPFARASVRHYSEDLSFRSSQWDTFNFTFTEVDTGNPGAATRPNDLQSFPKFDQTYGTIEVGTTISLTPKIRARVNAMSEVLADDIDRWGVGFSLQRRF